MYTVHITLISHCDKTQAQVSARMRVEFDFNIFGQTVNTRSRRNWYSERFFPRLQHVVRNDHVWELELLNFTQHLNWVQTRTV
jgi:hypothetical protein